MTSLPQTNGTNQIVLYKAEDGTMQMDVRLQNETIWLSQKQMAELFAVDRTVVTKHIKNTFDSGELAKDSVCANFAHTAEDGKTYQTAYYNLDAIISVGYRVNSKRGTQFRIWATNVLRKHLIDGYTLHQKRLEEKGTKELEQALALIDRVKSSPELSSDQAKGLLDVVTKYTQTWLLLRKYDDGDVEAPTGMQKPTYRLTYIDAQLAIQSLRENLAAKGEASSLFGNERGEMLQGIIGNIYQTFDQQELYRTMEEKAAHLLYFVIKDHPLTDGNKRIAVLLFLTFLQRNSVLPHLRGLSDNTLVALALLIAESDPKEKEMLIRLILHFIVSSSVVGGE